MYLRLFGKPSSIWSRIDTGPIGIPPFTTMTAAVGNPIWDRLTIQSLLYDEVSNTSLFECALKITSLFYNTVEVHYRG